MKNTLFKKVLAVALACTMTFSMATVTHAADAKEITIGVTSFADTLEPTEQYFSWVVSRYAIGECLTKFDEEGEIVPCLAESWENSEDGLTWTFKIREGVKFSNGDDMTPEMVMASIQRTADKSDRVPEFFDLDSMEVDGQNLIMLLNDPESGAPICVLDAKMLTQLRTGAVGAGMGAKALAKRDARSVCLVGCGAQGLYQLLFCCLVRPIERIALFDAYAKDLSSFVCRVREMTGVKQIDVCQSAAEAARDADILVTATTAKSPVFPDDAALFRGKCCIGIGSYKPDMREYPDALMETRPLVVADCAHALEESGDLKDPLEKGLLRAEDVRELSDLLGRYESGEGTVFYKSVGMALFDVVTARRIYELASARGAGVEVQW